MAGAAPSFSRVHVVRALLALAGGRVGRKNLVRELGVGEGSVRTILGRLRGEGLITSDKLGHALTGKGEGEVQNYLKKFTLPERFSLEGIGLPEVEGTEKCLVVVFNSTGKIKSGMEQRDTALSSGAKGALVIVFGGGGLRFPNTDIKLSDFPDLAGVLGGLSLREGDAVVISFGDSYARAEDGAVAVALKLIDGI